MRPDRRHHVLDRGGVADVARVGLDRADVAELAGRALEHFGAAAADDDARAELEKAPRHALSQPGAAARDQDALAVEESVTEHGTPSASLEQLYDTAYMGLGIWCTYTP